MFKIDLVLESFVVFDYCIIIIHCTLLVLVVWQLKCMFIFCILAI